MVQDRRPRENGTIVTRGWSRAAVGALGGLSAVIVKYITQDNATVVSFISQYSADPTAIPFNGFLPYIVTYAIYTPALLFLGGVIGWVSGEKIAVKLFALGVSAPALITTWSPASPPAQTQLAATGASSVLVTEAYAASIAQPFGYVVQAGAFAGPDPAKKLEENINARNGALRAFVVQVNDSTPAPYKVRVLSYMSFGDALQLRQALLNEGFTEDAILVDMSKAPK